MKCLLTGGNGFVGRELVAYLTYQGTRVCTSTRQQTDTVIASVSENYCVGNIDQHTDWRPAVTGQEVVVHLANRAHVINARQPAALNLYRGVNVEGTVNLARQCVAAKVKRFVYLSSIQVHGEETFKQAFRNDDDVNPITPYAISKLEAETGLQQLCKNSDMELVIIRPPLIYGPNVKGNLKRLIRAIDQGWPLPLGAIVNQRDLISLSNLAHLIGECMRLPAASGEIFLCSDGQAISTPELVEYIARARNKVSHVLKLPVSVLELLCRVTGKSSTYRRLCGDVRIDIGHTKSTLQWQPPYTTEESMNWAFMPKNINP